MAYKDGRLCEYRRRTPHATNVIRGKKKGRCSSPAGKIAANYGRPLPGKRRGPVGRKTHRHHQDTRAKAKGWVRGLRETRAECATSMRQIGGQGETLAAAVASSSATFRGAVCPIFIEPARLPNILPSGGPSSVFEALGPDSPEWKIFRGSVPKGNDLRLQPGRA